MVQHVAMTLVPGVRTLTGLRPLVRHQIRKIAIQEPSIGQGRARHIKQVVLPAVTILG